MTKRTLSLLAVPLAGALALAACGGDDEESADTTASGGASAGSLAGVCPDTVVIQTDWNPEAEHGAAYELVGDGYTVDTGKKTVTGPLVAGGEDTGVKVEVRIGGPAIGFQLVTAQMYQDPSITLGFVNTDEAAALSVDQPTLAVLAPLEKNPQILMWGPEAFPDAKEVKDVPADTKVVTFGPAVYQQWLIAEGIITKDQIDGSYDASPARFVAEGGKILQQGFASAEPYIYENEVEEWGKPVAFQLIHDMGFEIYSQALAIRAADKDELDACLKLLVPIYQQAAIDYVNDPAETNTLILELVEKFETGWVYSQGVADFSVEQQKKLGLVGNGPDDTLGNMDEARVQKIIDELVPIFEAEGTPIKEGLKASDIITNEYVDTSIGL
jgi:hypothetical protein